MKNMTRWIAIVGISSILSVGAVSADSFSAYFGSDGFGFGINMGNYDYYNRYSTGFYDRGMMDFQTALTPYGMWRYVPELGGQVWIPNVPLGWRPYTNGSWSYTDYGWTWLAYEPWGWIPHHYGNWIYHRMYQWVWVPDYVWYPANVVWGFFNGYYGWAPRPPQHAPYYRANDRYRRDHGYHWYSNSLDYNQRGPYGGQTQYNDNDQYEWIPNDAWVIVSGNQFMSDNIAEIAVRPDDNMKLFENRSFKLNQNAPAKTIIEKDIRRSVPLTKMDETTKQVNGKNIKVVRPSNIEPQRVKKIGNVQKNFQTVNSQKKQSSEPIRPDKQQPVRPNSQNPVSKPSQQQIRPESRTVAPEQPRQPPQQQVRPNTISPPRTQPRPQARPNTISPPQKPPQQQVRPNTISPPRQPPQQQVRPGQKQQADQAAPQQLNRPEKSDEPKSNESPQKPRERKNQIRFPGRQANPGETRKDNEDQENKDNAAGSIKQN